MSVPEFVVGEIIDGKYLVEDLLGRSGPLATYRAVGPSSQQVALKIYDPRLESFPEVVRALACSETITREIPSAAVAHILDGGKDPVTGAPYTVTLFNADPPLAEVVAWTPLSPADLITFVRNLAKVLDEVHSRGIAHLSLKPTNVFVGSAPSYNVQLVDFAMSDVRRALSGPDENRAPDAWLAPEQVAGAAAAGPAADVFACALLGFFALTGMSYWRSFQSDAPDASAWRSELYGERVPVSKRAGELSVTLDSAIDTVFARALSISPRRRFQTAGQFAEALAVALETPALVPPASVYPSGAPVERDFAVDPESSSPTSTSAVVMAPAVLAAGQRANPEPAVLVDVPPPPAQKEAGPAEPLLVRIRTGLTIPPPRDWSPALWTAAVVGGLAIAGAIVYPIVVHRSAAMPEGAASGSGPAASETSISASATPPTGTSVGLDKHSSAATATTAPRSPTPTAKPESKTVRSSAPVHSGAAASGPSRKPCGKGLKPCK